MIRKQDATNPLYNSPDAAEDISKSLQRLRISFKKYVLDPHAHIYLDVKYLMEDCKLDENQPSARQSAYF